MLKQGTKLCMKGLGGFGHDAGGTVFTSIIYLRASASNKLSLRGRTVREQEGKHKKVGETFERKPSCLGSEQVALSQAP